MDLLAFKNSKRKSASRRLLRLLNRHCVSGLGTDERRGDSRVLYPQPACIIPLSKRDVPQPEQKQTVFLCDLSATGIGFYTPHAIGASVLLLHMTVDPAEDQGNGELYVKLRVRQSSECQEGLIRTGCEIVEEIQPTGKYADLPDLFTAESESAQASWQEAPARRPSPVGG